MHDSNGYDNLRFQMASNGFYEFSFFWKKLLILVTQMVSLFVFYRPRKILAIKEFDFVTPNHYIYIIVTPISILHNVTIITPDIRE